MKSAFEALPQQVDTGKRVVFQILRRTKDKVAGGLAKASVVISQRRYPGAGQGIGNHSKRLVLINLFIPILEAASGDHYKDRCFAGAAFRQHQCPLQHSVSVGERDFFRGVRERSHGRLWPIQFLHTRSKCHRQRGAPLLESPYNLLYQPLSFISSADGRNLDGNIAHFSSCYLDGDAFGSLIR